jgi:AcrR family transcriptional regulator
VDSGDATRDNTPTDDGGSDRRAGRRLLRRDERRAQLLRAAAHAFLEGGFAATSLDDVAIAAGVTKMIIYRHFDSKRDLYQEVLRDTRDRIRARIGAPDQYGPHTTRELALAARDDPDGFRLLYRHALREPDFASYADEMNSTASLNSDSTLRGLIPDPGRRAWVAQLLPAIAADTILTWLDTGQPVSVDTLTLAATTAMNAIVTSATMPAGSQAPLQDARADG